MQQSRSDASLRCGPFSLTKSEQPRAKANTYRKVRLPFTRGFSTTQLDIYQASAHYRAYSRTAFEVYPTRTKSTHRSPRNNPSSQAQLHHVQSSKQQNPLRNHPSAPLHPQLHKKTSPRLSPPVLSPPRTTSTLKLHPPTLASTSRHRTRSLTYRLSPQL